MRLKILGWLLIGSLPAAQAHAQQQPSAARVLLSGIVADSLTGQPIAGATVTVPVAHRVAFTDSMGRFAIDLPRRAAQEVQVRQFGYVTVSFPADIQPENPPLLVYLTPDPVPLQAMTARAKRSGRFTVEGTVVDSVTGRPLPNVVVWFRTSRGSAITDTLGHYVFDAAQPGSEDILVDVVGYERQTAFRRIAEPWQRLDFALPPNPFELQAVVAFGQRRHESVLAQGFSRVLTERDLAGSGLSSPQDFLRWAQSLSSPAGLECEFSQVMRLPKGRGDVSGLPAARPPRAASSPWVLPPLKSALIVDGQPLAFTVGGELVLREEFTVRPGEFYQAIVRRTSGCLGGNRTAFVAVSVYSKSYIRRMARRPGGLRSIPFDSLEALMAAADTLR